MRRDRYIKEKDHDPYEEGKKYPEGTYCPECKAIFHDGRWVWPRGNLIRGEAHLCPACRRIRDNYPAGEVYLKGKYFKDHREELVNLIKNIVRDEEKNSPMKRLISIKGRDSLVVTFTDDHLARRVGDAIYRAHKGKIDVKYSDESRFVRIHWSRDI
ncbi:MAG: ATPase [Deltaproteobacteria bacterium]|nr:MAG: ATPase [Deltaproteobacteria bacterium]